MQITNRFFRIIGWLIDFLKKNNAGGEPAVLGDHLQPSDGGLVGRGAGQLGQDMGFIKAAFEVWKPGLRLAKRFMYFQKRRVGRKTGRLSKESAAFLPQFWKAGENPHPYDGSLFVGEAEKKDRSNRWPRPKN